MPGIQADPAHLAYESPWCYASSGRESDRAGSNDAAIQWGGGSIVCEVTAGAVDDAVCQLYRRMHRLVRFARLRSEGAGESCINPCTLAK